MDLRDAPGRTPALRTRILGLALAIALQACGAEDLHRFAGIPQGTLVVGLGMPMSEVARRSSVKLHRLQMAGLSTGFYSNGSAYFDFELAGSSLRFHGCSMLSIDFEGPTETVTMINVHITPSHHRWSAQQRELRETAAKLAADGWEPVPHDQDGWEPLATFVARDGAKLESSDSGAIAVFEWRKKDTSLRLTAHRAWDAPQFWSSVDIVPAAFWDPPALALPTPPPGGRPQWLSEFPAYERATKVCSGHATGGAKERGLEITFSMYASPDAPYMAVYNYKVERGLRDVVGDTTLSVASANGKKRVSIHPVGDAYPDCGTKPTPSTQTVFIVSESP